MMAANYRHIGGGENRLGRHYSRFSGIWLTSFFADQSLTLRKSQNAGSNRPSRAKNEDVIMAQDTRARISARASERSTKQLTTVAPAQMTPSCSRAAISAADSPSQSP